MQTITRLGHTLSGTTPAAEGVRFRICTGDRELWQGAAGTNFSVDINSPAQTIFLVSSKPCRTEWNQLSWSGQYEQTASSGHHTISADKLGMKPDGKDAGPALRRALREARKLTGAADGAATCTINIPKGVYHFYPENAHQLSFYVSNHDQQNQLPIGIPLIDLHRVTLEANGSVFIFHGRMQPIAICHSTGITCKGMDIRTGTPYSAEGKILSIKDGITTVQIPSKFPWDLRKGKMYNTGEAGARPVRCALAFNKDGSMVGTGKSGDIVWNVPARQMGKSRVAFRIDAAKHGLRPGHILVLRGYERPYPAMFIHRSEQTVLKDIVFRDSQGMTLLAQLSRDVEIDGGGCICAKGRVHTSSADATHFSNCTGKIYVHGALYEGMMDDAINVHSTCLSIEEVRGPRHIIAKFMHHQAVGLPLFRKGDKLQFISGKRLENHPQLNEVAAVHQLSETKVALELEDPLPEGICTGDAVENADYYPSVHFTGNTVRHNRARGALFTTPERVLVEDNKFIQSSGSAILLAGDAQGWYESGRCRDVIIRNNLFDHNLTCRYQFTEGIISIYPEVREIEQQKERYHENIIIEGNTFLTHRVPLLYAQSTRRIIFRNNEVKVDDAFPPMNDGKPFILYHCEDFRTDFQQP